ncbi:alpha/beta fold hydrolase [Salinibacterium sp. ZJ70]|uniref:alpha/beta fold hydrolase n=1 Tax=Salinibacterium sp. ZJ70 TaxID=2708084 RepID=UPI001422AD66|nr:alpha/beta fold hydrolase [Salinibacterium sp. ZJ70]
MLDYEDTRRTVSVNGHEFSFHEAGSGTPLLMLHGSGPGVSAWSNFQHNLPVLAEHFRVIMPDLPGFGRSDLPHIDEVYPAFAARWMLHLMDALEIESAHVVGNSMGGSIAAELADLAPERVTRLALMGPGGLAVSVFNSDPSEGAKRLFEFLDDPTRERMVAWVECMVADPARITDELIDERMANATAPGAVERAKEIFGSIFNPALASRHRPLWTRAAGIQTPTLIIWGREDRMLPYDQAHFAVRQMPDGELHTFARCGHWAQIERKNEFERLVIEFFTRD